MKKITKYIPYLSLIWLLVFIKPETFIFFWQVAFYLLVLIMFARPIRDIFPKLKFLNKIVSIRKELWIVIWCFAFAHFLWYFFDTKAPINIILNSNIWSIDSFMAWWFIAFFVSIPLLLTSNTFSMIKMWWKNWKRVQYLAYIMFIATIIHIALVKKDEAFFLYTIFVIYLFVLFYSAYLNKKKNYEK